MSKKKRSFHLNYARNYYEPIGPPSALIDPSAFVADAKAALDRASEALVTLKVLLTVSGAQEDIVNRCSVSDLRDSVAALHLDGRLVADLRKWHAARILPSEQAKVEGESGAGGNEEDDQPAEDEDMEDDEPAMGTAAIEASNPALAKLAEEANSCGLGILKPIKDIPYFLRKTKAPDYNTISQLTPAPASTDPPPTGLLKSPLSTLLYTITILPIPRICSKHPFNVRAQTLHCLGSTTLWELRANIRAGGDAVPIELEDEEEDDEDDEDEENVPRKRPKWSAERRDVGSLFGIEGVLYADRREGKQDYAEMVISLIDSVNWTSRPKPPDPSGYPDIEVGGRSRRSSSSGSSSSSPRPQLDEDQAPTKPNWIAGTSMQETQIGTLSLKTGEPYWYMHQGNCEHIWIVECIRSVHPEDPPLKDDFSTYPYPITSFLSRSRDAEAKCRLCDRDPGSIITLEDELAGESPALLCATCFEMLHGDNEDGHVIVIPNLWEL